MKTFYWILAALTVLGVGYYLYRYKQGNADDTSSFSRFIPFNSAKQEGQRVLGRNDITKPNMMSEFAWQEILNTVGHTSRNKPDHERIRLAVYNLHDVKGKIILREKEAILNQLKK